MRFITRPAKAWPPVGPDRASGASKASRRALMADIVTNSARRDYEIPSRPGRPAWS